MKKIVIASNNEHKIKEIKEILKEFPFEVIGMQEAGVDIEVEETGETFMENAYLKAKAIYDSFSNEDYLIISDDSGIAVDALDGKPGVYSARFAGEHGNSKKNNDKLLAMLEGKSFEERKAKFICAMVLIGLGEGAIKVQGEVEGYVTYEERGIDGFGYDPIFYVAEFQKTFAEMTAYEKNAVSHRGRALEMLTNEIASRLKL